MYGEMKGKLMKILLIDGHSLLYRSFYALPNLCNSVQQYTGGIYGFLHSLQKVQSQQAVDAVCVTFDSKSPTFRHLAHPEYKAGRSKQPEEMKSQFPLLKEILSAMNIPIYAEEGWEADDLLGTLSLQAEEQGWEVLILTGDKDVLQLVSTKTTVLYTSSDRSGSKIVPYTPELFVEKYGFPPLQLVDFKALVGDNSDNYKGVKGIGEKKAEVLIAEYGGIDPLYEKLQDPQETLGLTASFLSKLRLGEEDARFCHELATIRRNAPISFQATEGMGMAYDNKALYGYLKELELNKLVVLYGLAEFSKQENKDYSTACPLGYLGTMAEVEAVLEDRQSQWVLLPLEGLAGVALQRGLGENAVCYLLTEQHCSDYAQALARLFSTEGTFVVWNSKTLYTQVAQQGISPQCKFFDVELGAYLLSPDSRSYDLRDMCLQYGQISLPSLSLTVESFGILGCSPEAEEALVLWSLGLQYLGTEVGKRLAQQSLQSLYEEIELPLVPVLVTMEQAGISLDKVSLEAYDRKLLGEITVIEQCIHQETGVDFNISSPKQLGEVLFETMGFEGGKKGKTGYSTNATVLESLLEANPDSQLLRNIMTYRQLSKLQTTYSKGLLKSMGKDNKIHCHFQNTVTATGRLSCSEPNLQNIPIRTALGAELRHMFVADQGRVLVGGDYSQIELRLLAHMSGDESMISAFLSGRDFHQETASRVFSVPTEEVTSQQRRAAKAVNFGVIYGMGAFSLSQDLGVSFALAQQYIDDFFRAYPKVQAYFEEILTIGRQTTTVSTIYGRKRWISDLKHHNHNIRNNAERMAKNMPLQGTAADLMKLAMVRVGQSLQQSGTEARILLQVHDELILDCPTAQADAVSTILQQQMEAVATLSVPLTVDVRTGASWGEIH